MQLRAARLCLDCEEVHQENICPACASEMFAYLSRWVPAGERRARRRPVPLASTSQTQSKSGLRRWIQRGAFGLAAVAAGRWLLENTRRSDGSDPSASQDVDPRGPTSDAQQRGGSSGQGGPPGA